jgi:type II secretory pathway predicted ATPase ExeA
MLVEQLWHQLSRNSYAVSKVVTTQVSGDDLLRLVMDGFGLSVLPGTEKSVLLRRFENMVREQRNVSRRCVLVVDEVQNLSFAALEELRMLSNITVDGKASVQTILLGQPQFRPTLASRDAEQLRQRVLASFHLGPLSEVETRLYIEHRLKTVGWSDNPHWDEDAFAAVHRHSDGTPRRINTLCSRVLQFGALEERSEITGAMVDEVASEMADGMNGPDAPGQDVNGAQQANPMTPDKIAANDTPDVYSAYRAQGSGELGDLLHRIEALEEVTARQDRVFQRILKMLALAVQKEP